MKCMEYLLHATRINLPAGQESPAEWQTEHHNEWQAFLFSENGKTQTGTGKIGEKLAAKEQSKRACGRMIVFAGPENHPK